MKGKVAPPIRSAASRAATQARQTGQHTGRAVQSAATAQSGAIDHAAHQAHTRFAALPHDGEIDDAKLDHTVTGITASFTQVHNQGATAVTGEAAKVKTSLTHVHQHFTANLTRAAGKLEADI